MSYGILIIEDEAILAKKIAKYLSKNGFETRVADSGREGLETLKQFHPDAVLLDFNLPGDMNGLEVLKEIRQHDSTIQIIMITGYGNVRLAVDAMKAGAYDYLSKPIVLSELNILLNRAIGQNLREGQLSYFHAKQAKQSDMEQIVGSSEAIRQVKQQIQRVVEASGSVTEGTLPAILISGETGTGKELVARALHFCGPRNKGPFIELNVANLPSDLVDSELFGFEKGAFTDARERRLGLVEAATGGTLFLDEIGELDLGIQAKLLKLIEDRNVRRLGSLRSSNVDVQIITATNRSLQNMVEEGRFRADLFFRLNTLTIVMPPLRMRDGDIRLLVDHFVSVYGKKYNKPGLAIESDVIQLLEQYHWPGNVRELSNVVEQAALLCGSKGISVEHITLPRFSAGSRSGEQSTGTTMNETSPSPKPGTTLHEMEKELIQRTLLSVDGNVSKAARILGISRDQIRYRIEKYAIDQKS